jgi:hypothetical protein
MGFKTIEEMVSGIKEYGKNFYADIPEKFTVHSDYLTDELTEQFFCDGYRAYQKKMQALQSDMCERPEDYGLIAFDKKGAQKPAYSMANPYVWLFLALGQAGNIVDGKLKIDKNMFEDFCAGKKSVGKNESSPKNIEKLLDRLGGHGFVISKDTGGDFTIASDLPYLMPAIKSSALSPYARTSMTSDYPTFNWRMYKYGILEKLPFEQTYTYNQMTPDMRGFSMLLLNSLAGEGWKSYIFFPHSMHGGRLTFPTVEYYYSTTGSTILFRLNGTQATPEFLDSLSEKFRKVWENSARCKACKGEKTKECRGRVTGEYFGRSGVFCRGSKVFYYEHDIDDMPDVIASAKYCVGKKL